MSRPTPPPRPSLRSPALALRRRRGQRHLDRRRRRGRFRRGQCLRGQRRRGQRRRDQRRLDQRRRDQRYRDQRPRDQRRPGVAPRRYFRSSAVTAALRMSPSSTPTERSTFAGFFRPSGGVPYQGRAATRNPSRLPSCLSTEPCSWPRPRNLTQQHTSIRYTSKVVTRRHNNSLAK